MANSQPNIPTKVYRVSWFVYLPAILIYLVLIPVVLSLTKTISFVTIFISLVITAVFVGYVLNQFKLSITLCNEGVILRSGFFPWNSVEHRLKWKNYIYARYSTNFVSWLFKSYSVKLDEFHLFHIHNGHLLVTEINEVIEKMNLDVSLQKSVRL